MGTRKVVELGRGELAPIEELRRMVRYFNALAEDFNAAFTHEQLRKIWLFACSEQGGRVHELADHWPEYLLGAVLKREAGARIDETIVKRAGEEC